MKPNSIIATSSVVASVTAAILFFLPSSEAVHAALASQSKNIYCDPITRSNHDDFEKHLTQARGMPNAEIVASNIAISPQGQLVFYALVCSKK